MNASSELKFYARKMMRLAIKHGDLIRQSCRDCGSTDRIAGHHVDYSRPLDVIWLCPGCHAREHTDSRPDGNDNSAMLGLTRRQSEVLKFIKDFSEQRGYSPSYEEIGVGMELSSLATIHKHVAALRARGVITSGHGIGRSIRVIEGATI